MHSSIRDHSVEQEKSVRVKVRAKVEKSKNSIMMKPPLDHSSET